MSEDIFSGDESAPKKKLAAPVRSKRQVKKNTTVVKRTASAKLKQKDMWLPENRTEVVSGLRRGLLKAAREKFGTSRVFGSQEDMEKLIVGIPMPSLAFEWLLDSQVLPLRSMLMLTGTWSSNKSSLLYEMMRWFVELNGLATLVDTETKFDARLAASVMRQRGKEPEYLYERAYSVQEAQSMLITGFKNVVKLMHGTKEEPGPGLCVPCIFGLDSLAAATAQASIDAVHTDGHASRKFPEEALLNKFFVQAALPTIAKYPMLFAIVNHRKTKQDKDGYEFEYTPGGTDQNFMEAIELKNSVWKSRIASANFSGAGIRISNIKNSFGRDKRSIKTRFLWWEEIEETTGKQVRKHIWDWNWSIVCLLSEADGPLKAALKANDLLVEAKSKDADVGCLANMRSLGMGKDEYIPWQELGQRIHDNAEIRGRIRLALGIQQGMVLDGPIDEVVDLHIGKKGKGRKK